ncbi:2-dehydropantoate 2-reductase [Mesorhizobium sp. 8]|uniref:2-dehydropantoate 2-reductase n=1 Tax=Mesorhizobium sp. 8 TaxID=2584466 RepID=UPI00111DB624|nr:2-dehydropantoate 2-reductase [Mesorhizobium sp. 8]QDC02578.1 2-dehydropantoate 2-reductase [Mesorhizobium sp. 8]
METRKISTDAHIVVAGAGGIGCYVGGCLARAGRKVTFLARPRIEQALRENGLRISDLDGHDRLLAPDAVDASADPAVLAGADVVLVTVKRGATEEMGKLVAAHARPDAIVVSLQNGVDNADRIRSLTAPRPVLAGMVPFNVAQSSEGERPLHMHRASEGTVLVGAGVPGLAELLSVEGCVSAAHADIEDVLWGKLLFNLNNALVALSDLPLAAELADRRWRLVLARQMDEALTAMKASGIRPVAAAGGAPPALLPSILRLPDWLFALLARRMLAIDGKARSSMWDDLQRGRPTEVDALQGAVLRLAKRAGTAAPTIERTIALVRAAERAGSGVPRLAPDAFD